MKALLFAAGLGTRLQPFTNFHPKALAKVNNKTLLEHNIIYLKQHSITQIVINVHHFANQMEEAIAQLSKQYGISIHISNEENELLETGGGLLKAAPLLLGTQPIVVMNVDMLTKFNLTSLIKQHNSHPSALATLAVSQRSSSRALYFDTHMNLCSWANTSTNQTKIARETQPTQAFAFSGIHVINPQILNILPFTGKFGIIDAYLELAKTHDIKGYQHTNALTIDVGKPESIIEAEKHFT